MVKFLGLMGLVGSLAFGSLAQAYVCSLPDGSKKLAMYWGHGYGEVYFFNEADGPKFGAMLKSGRVSDCVTRFSIDSEEKQAKFTLLSFNKNCGGQAADYKWIGILNLNGQESFLDCK